MAFTVVEVGSGANHASFLVTATADTDMEVDIHHLLGADVVVVLEPLSAQGLQKEWYATVNLGVGGVPFVYVVGEENPLDSGSATPQLRVTVLKPHSLFK